MVRTSDSGVSIGVSEMDSERVYNRCVGGGRNWVVGHDVLVGLTFES
jgi:hypothetical protein